MTRTLGVDSLTINGTKYKLDWGDAVLTVSDQWGPLAHIKNTRLAYMLASMPLHDVVSREIGHAKR